MQADQGQLWQSPLTQSQLTSIFKQQQTVSLTLNHQRGITCTLYRQDYESMLPQKWLRTQALDLIIKILYQNYAKQLIKTYASRGILNEKDPFQYVKLVDGFVGTLIMNNSDQVILQSLAPLQLFSQRTKYLLLPINTQFQQGQHWILALLINGNYSKSQTPTRLYIFDSGWGPSYMAQRVKQRLQLFYSAIYEQKLEIEICEAEGIAKQTNGYDCGIFVIGFSEYVLLEIIEELQEQQPLRLNQLCGKYKYLLSNSTMARERYRKMLQAKITQSLS